MLPLGYLQIRRDVPLLQLDGTSEALSARNKEFAELKELYEVSQETASRLNKALRTA